MNGKRPYFPNNWKEYKECDDDMFVPHTFFEVMEWKVNGWILPSSVDCIIRTTHLKTRKVKEYVYKRRAYAERKIKQLVHDQDHEFCVTTHESQHFIGPRPADVDEGDL